MAPDTGAAGRASPTGLLAGAAMGVYLLVVAGATAAVADAAAACPTWPACGGRWLAPASDPRVLVALGHRAAALAVGAVLLAAVAVGWRRAATRGERAGLLAAAALYPVQVALGALTATAGAPAVLSGAHLVVGVSIFGALVLALAWRLEALTGDAADGGTGGVADDRTGDTTADGTGGAPDAGTPAGVRGATAPSESIAAGVSSGETSGRPARARDRLLAYVRLLKPRLMWLLCLVAAAGMALAAGPGLSARTVVTTLGGGVLAIGASGTFNHVIERDTDRRMARTADRPLATDAVPVRRALALGVALAAASVAVFLTLNALAAALGLSAILFYSVVYTVVLKPNTDKNTVVGGLAGSFPAVIGWVAVTGEVGLPGLALAGVVFLWTPAHFYNLALAYREDYERGGFPMLPVVRGEATTRKHVLLYLGATLVAVAGLSAVAGLGPLPAATSVAVGAAFLWAVVRLHRERTRAAALRAFHASNAYLGALLVAVVVDALVL